ncbi:exported hypothetical protein [Mesorhizobium sp. STM 4661]|nr:exported hypothetical protein [Mesorhizobium sp. STM 4661]
MAIWSIGGVLLSGMRLVRHAALSGIGVASERIAQGRPLGMTHSQPCGSGSGLVSRPTRLALE